MTPPLTLLTALAKQIGPAAATFVLRKLGGAKDATTKWEHVMEAIKQGTSAVSALRNEFGDDFLVALNLSGRNHSAHSWTYEAGGDDYTKLPLGQSRESKIIALRDELNVNLDRIVKIGKVSDATLLNYFRGTLAKWKRRYAQALGTDDDSRRNFKTMDDLLDGKARTFKDAVETLSRTSVGVVGALMVISGVMLATSTGVGVVTWISIFLFGIPWAAVGAIVIPGVILLALSQYKFTNKHAMTTCVKLAYKMLEERHNKLTEES